MNEAQLVGYAVIAIITLGSFIAVIMKFTQPINDLRVVIQKLNDMIDTLKNDNTQQNKKLEKHDDQLDKLDHRVSKVETKIEMYHKQG